MHPYFIYACVPGSGHKILVRSRFSVGALSTTLDHDWIGILYCYNMLLLSVHVGSLFGVFLKKRNHILYSASTTCLPGVWPTLWSGIGWLCRVCWVNNLQVKLICERCAFECDWENTALVQWIRCEPLGEHLIHWTCAVYSHVARKRNNVYFISHDQVTYDITAVDCSWTTARVRYGLIPIYVS